MTVAAVGSERTLSYVAESTFGVTPGTPSMKYVRALSGAKFDLARSTFTSNEITPTRQVKFLTYGNRSGSGDIPFELSYGSFDDFIEATLGGTWATNVLKIGTTDRSFTFEEGYPDISIYEQSTGVVFTGMSLSVKPNQVVNGSFKVLFKDQAAAATLDASPDAANTNPVYDSFTGSITEGGSTLATVTSLDLSIDQTGTPSNVLFDATAQSITLGKVNVTGTIAVRFTSNALKAKFLAGTTTDLSFTLGSGLALGKSIKFDMSNVKYTSASNSTDETELTQTLNFTAIYDETDATSLMVTRIP
jgi:hypothetical protein